MNELVKRLSEGEHPITVGGPTPSPGELKKRLEDIGYVFIKFTTTRGGTDLGIRVDRQATDVSRANFDQGSGQAHIEGTLTLNYTKVRCIADIDLTTLNGTLTLNYTKVRCIADIDLTTLNGTGHLVALEEVHP